MVNREDWIDEIEPPPRALDVCVAAGVRYLCFERTVPKILCLDCLKVFEFGAFGSHATKNKCEKREIFVQYTDGTFGRAPGSKMLWTDYFFCYAKTIHPELDDNAIDQKAYKYIKHWRKESNKGMVYNVLFYATPAFMMTPANVHHVKGLCVTREGTGQGTEEEEEDGILCGKAFALNRCKEHEEKCPFSSNLLFKTHWRPARTHVYVEKCYSGRSSDTSDDEKQSSDSSEGKSA